MAIADPSSMDKPLARRRDAWRRGALFAGGLAVVAGLLLAPVARRWMRAEVAADAASLRTAVVERGDLERDVAVQGRVVAASHPTLFSSAFGTISLSARTGAVVKRGEVVARVSSPELVSRLEQ